MIRSLMERATIYRAISAPSALVGGVLSLIAAACLDFGYRPLRTADLSGYERVFLTAWLAVLILTAAANAWILWHEAGRRHETFFSAGMRLALRALLPSALCAAFFTLALAWLGEVIVLPPFWMLFYGLGLLATAHFAPRSIFWLGWAFLTAALCSFASLYLVSMDGGGDEHGAYLLSNIVMGAAFGIFHLIYAACTWPRKAARAELGGVR